MQIHTLSGIAAIASLASLPLAASADQSLAVLGSAPVSATCSIDAQTPYSIFHPGDSIGNGYRVRFVNNGSVAATKVAVRVNYNGATQLFTTAGTFARGTRIDRDFGGAPYTAGGDAQPSCTVSEVDFSDGSSWQHTVAANETGPAITTAGR